MPRTVTVLLLFAFLLPLGVNAQTIIEETSFEVPSPGSDYTDTGDPSVDHDLTNNPGESPVDFSASGGEMGFDSRYVNTRDGDGLTEGDDVGVVENGPDTFVDGSQGFAIEDPDGKMVTEFDAVDLSGTSTPYVSVQYYIESTGWEGTDKLRIYVRLSGGGEVDLVNLNGDQIDNDDSGPGREGEWIFVQKDLSSYTAQDATLIFAVDSNAGTEAVYFDQVQFSSDGPIPVELASFDVSTDGQRGVLTWQTSSETNNAGFAVQHQSPASSDWRKIGYREGEGTTTQPQSYRFTTDRLGSGTHTFRLKQVDTDGTAHFSAPKTVAVRGTAGLTLLSGHPVVRGQSAVVSIEVPTRQSVTVTLYDVLGQQVRTVTSTKMAPGQPTRATVSTADLSSGIYFLRAQGASFQQTKKLTVVQ